MAVIKLGYENVDVNKSNSQRISCWQWDSETLCRNIFILLDPWASWLRSTKFCRHEPLGSSLFQSGITLKTFHSIFTCQLYETKPKKTTINTMNSIMLALYVIRPPHRRMEPGLMLENVWFSAHLTLNGLCQMVQNSAFSSYVMTFNWFFPPIP